VLSTVSENKPSENTPSENKPSENKPSEMQTIPSSDLVLTPERVNEPMNETARATRKRPLRLKVQGWVRWLHVYTSMFSLIIVLFFSLTGLTLNHPDWAFGNVSTQQETKGTLPAGWKVAGKVEWLTVVEYLRSQNKVRGSAADMRSDDSESTVRFAAPGYSADAVIDTPTGQYTLTTTAQGLVAVMNDFHRGRDTGAAWSWVIDLSAGFLTLVALTGLGLLLYLKKIRASALLALLGGGVLMAVIMKLAS
jgi:uncharacterized protein